MDFWANFAELKTELNTYTPDEVVDFSRAHVEVLHVLHNSIQENFFKCTEPYDYRKEGKRVEWTRILRGA